MPSGSCAPQPPRSNMALPDPPEKQKGTRMAIFGIIVGGGPAPGINGVIGAAALTAARAGARVVGLLDGFSHVMQGDALPHEGAASRGGLPDPPARRLDPAHIAGQSYEESRASRERRESAGLSRHHPPRDDRRGRHGLLRKTSRRHRQRVESGWPTCRRQSTTICRCLATSRPSALRRLVSTRPPLSSASPRIRARRADGFSS